MSKPINLCYPTLNRYDLLADSIESVCKGTLKPTLISIVDNGGKFAEKFGDIKEAYGVPLKIYVPVINIGVGRAWNYFFNTLEDNIVIANDDTLFNETTLELLIKATEDNPNEIFFTPDGFWEHFFSLYCMRKEYWTKLGEFDNNYFAYHEDPDMCYRMKLAGYKPFVVKDCTYTHYEGGSNTIKIDQSVNNNFAKYGEYYRLKWNGLRGNENYTKPFNLLG